MLHALYQVDVPLQKSILNAKDGNPVMDSRYLFPIDSIPQLTEKVQSSQRIAVAVLTGILPRISEDLECSKVVLEMQIPDNM